MNPLTPSRARTQQRVSSDLHNTTSPVRGKTAHSQPLYTTVDNLLLPGVIGATVEGPKTPLRTPNAKRVLDFFTHTNTKGGSNRNKMAIPSSPFGVPQTRRTSSYSYIDAEIAVDRPLSLNHDHSNRNYNNSPPTPQGKQYRKAFRPHDTPISGSKRPSRFNNVDNVRNNVNNNGRRSDGTSYLYNTSPFVDGQVDNRAGPMSPFSRKNSNDIEYGGEDDEDDKENQPRLANLRSHQETKRTPTNHRFYSRERPQPDDGDGSRDMINNTYEEDDEGLDIGGQEDEIYPNDKFRGNVYQSGIQDDQEDESMDEREMAELKREQEQIGFIKRMAHLLRKQRDEFGWGPTKHQDGQPSEGSDVDSDSSFTSARVRRESYQRKKIPVASRLNRMISVPSKSPSPTPQQKSPTPQQRSLTPQPLSSQLQKASSQSQPTSPRSPDKSPFNIPSMRQFDSGIGLDGSQESHDEFDHLEELPEEEIYENIRGDDNTKDPGAEEESLIAQDTIQPLERHPTPPSRPSSRIATIKREDEADVQPYVMEHYGEHSDTSDYESDIDRRPRFRQSSKMHYSAEPRYNWHQEVVHSTLYPSDESDQPRVYPWHVVGHTIISYMDTLENAILSFKATLEFYAWTIASWISFIVLWPWTKRDIVWNIVDSWIRAGVASGLFRPGTLFGVALLGLAVWGSHKFGYDSFSEVKGGRNCDNETVLSNPSNGPLLKEIISNTWDKLSRQEIEEHNESIDSKIARKWFDWVPNVPTISNWIPFRKDTKDHSPLPSPTSTMEIPTEQIQSLEELELRIEWIQRALKDLGHADDRLDKKLHSELKSMSVRVSNVERNLNDVLNEVGSLKEYVRNGEWIEQTVELIRDEIPRHLVVAKDPKTGKLLIPSGFWNNVRELFMTSEDAQKIFQDQLALLDQDADAQEDASSGSSRWSWGSSRGKKKAGKAVKWEDFLLENEKAMNTFVEDRMSKVSRRVFLGLVRTEANEIWQSLERNVVALLEKQGKLEGKSAPDSTTDNNDPSRALTEVEQGLIMGLIDKALEKYSADVLAKPDFALYSAGGRIIPRLTSPNYYHYVEPTLLGRLGARFFVPLPRREKHPEKAIEPDMHAGECWAMDGQEGQLAVRLARKIIITEVTIEHADPSVVLDLGSAAREIEVWGLRGREDAAPTTPPSTRPKAEIPENDKKTQESQQGSSPSETTASTKPGSWWREGSPWPGSTLLTSFEFTAGSVSEDGDGTEKSKSRQTFSIPLSKQTVPSVGAVFRIKSNWGHPKMTCIYRVRVHGYEPTDTLDQK
ncbi:hypothetical protein FBU30_001195 [Linnemannia zychae]|nr:hypothetical protein FBU30_001195 [Linnemannia zychae]